MHRSRTATARIERIEHRWLRLMYPDLARVPSSHRARVLRAARATELDTSERIGIAGAVGVTAYLLQSTTDAAHGVFAVSLTQFVLAWPLLSILVAPWLVRRTRRGLQHEAQRFDGDESCPESQAPTPCPGTRPSRAAQTQPLASRRHP
jgi:hypothetical protein